MIISRETVFLSALLFFLCFVPGNGLPQSIAPKIGQEAPAPGPPIPKIGYDGQPPAPGPIAPKLPGVGSTSEIDSMIPKIGEDGHVKPSDLTTPRISRDGRIALIPIDPDNIEPVKELLSRLQGRWHDIAVEIYTPIGLLPCVVILGEPQRVKSSTEIIQEMFLRTGTKHMVIISATLRQLTESDVLSLGLNVIPSSITYSGSYHAERDFLTSTTTTKQGVLDIQINEGITSNIFQLNEGIGNGKILVEAEVFTPNGVKAQISDILHMPVFTVDVNSNVQTQFQDLETSISVTPIVMKFNTDHPLDATVRLDIGVKVSTVSGTQQMGSISAPQYSDKKFQTIRVFPADGKTYLVGTIVSDSLINSSSGFPFLSRIPLLKYLFSQNTTTKNRSYALLSLAVKVLSADESPDRFTVPWFQRKEKTHEKLFKEKSLGVSEKDLTHQLPAIPVNAIPSGR